MEKLLPTIKNWQGACTVSFRDKQIIILYTDFISSPSHNCPTQCGYLCLWNQSKNANLKLVFFSLVVTFTSLSREPYIPLLSHYWLCIASDNSVLFLRETSRFWQAAGDEGHSSLFFYPPWILAAEEARWSDSQLICLWSLEITIIGLLGKKM